MKKNKISWAKKSLCGRILCRVLGEEKGAVAMEYIVIALLVAAAVVGLVMVFSGSLRNMLGAVIDITTSTNVQEIEQAGKKLEDGKDKIKEQQKTAEGAGHKLGGDFSNN